MGQGSAQVALAVGALMVAPALWRPAPRPWAVAFLATLTLCLTVVNTGGLQIYFVGLPGWFVAALLYVVMSRLVQRKEVRS